MGCRAWCGGPKELRLLSVSEMDIGRMCRHVVDQGPKWVIIGNKSGI